MSWAERERQKMIRLYQDETGALDYKMADVAVWAKQRGFAMPKAPTDIEILTKQLARIARADRRSIPGLPDYRGQLAYTRLVNGQLEMFWFDADGPSATVDKVQRSLNLRKEQMLNIGAGMKATELHWKATHPSQSELKLDFDMEEEITWRVNAPKDRTERKAG
jgi:hypothetical protein